MNHKIPLPSWLSFESNDIFCSNWLLGKLSFAVFNELRVEPSFNILNYC